METLEEEQSKTTDDRLAKKTKISFPEEIIEEIFSRLPVKSILRFRSVCKPWLSLISDSSFTKLQFTRATASHRTALLISAYDPSTRKLHFLSAAHDGGSVTHLITLDNTPTSCDFIESEHLNGLVLFNYGNIAHNYSLVLNPSTHKIFKLPNHPNYTFRRLDTCYLFGFDESRNEHKVLSFTTLDVRSNKRTVEIRIFSFSNYSWRKIDGDFSFDISKHCWYPFNKRSVCVNSVVHLILLNQEEILAFDLRTEKFFIIKIPLAAVPLNKFKCDRPHLIKINGLLGVVYHQSMNEMHIWMLQDYENRVWVKETIKFPKSWIVLGCCLPLDSTNMEQIIFSLNKLSRDVISVLTYSMKSTCFKSVEFTLDHPLLCSETVQFQNINCYVESLVPLQ